MKKKNLTQRVIITALVTLIGFYVVFMPRGRRPHLSDFTYAGIKTTLGQNIKLGLDLKGGTHLVMRVKTDEYLQKLTENQMQTAQTAAGPARRLVLQEAPQPVSDRQVHFVMASDPHVDLATDAGKIRVTFIATPSGTRILHIKGLSCFVAHLGGRPSPAVTLEQPGDLALVTPRAQDRGHVRVANGVPEGNQSVFSIGSERVAIAAEDCSDPILFDFGPGLDAYFVYTRGRAVPKPPRRR